MAPQVSVLTGFDCNSEFLFRQTQRLEEGRLILTWLQQWVKITEGQPSGFSGTSLQNFSMAFSTPHALKIDLLHILSDFRMF